MKLIAALALATCIPVAAVAAAERDELTEFRIELEREFAGEVTVLAVCGASTGRAFYRDEATKGWQEDSISQGKYIFWMDSNGTRDVIFMDARGEFQSAMGDGGSVTQYFVHPDSGDFLWAVSYPQTGVTEIFNVTHDAGSPSLVLWSSNKPSLEYPTIPPVTLGPKVAAFVANCA